MLCEATYLPSWRSCNATTLHALHLRSERNGTCCDFARGKRIWGMEKRLVSISSGYKRLLSPDPTETSPITLWLSTLCPKNDCRALVPSTNAYKQQNTQELQDVRSRLLATALCITVLILSMGQIVIDIMCQQLASGQECPHSRRLNHQTSGK
jgi:hypothetical protein